jgi:hypothetical protein
MLSYKKGGLEDFVKNLIYVRTGALTPEKQNQIQQDKCRQMEPGKTESGKSVT